MSLHGQSTFTPRFELLEDRSVPAASGVVVNGTLVSILGTARNDRIIITLNGSLDVSTVNLNGVLCDLLPIVVMEQLTVDAGLGNDVVEVRAPVPISGSANLDVIINLGSGDDVGLLQTSRNVSSQALVTFEVNGNDGRDTITADFNGANIQTGALVAIDLNGGLGSDRITTLFRGRAQGDLDVSIDGGAGADRIVVNAIFRLSTGGSLNGPVRRIDTFTLDLTGGADGDTFDVTLRSDSGAPILLNASAVGGLGVDTINRTGNVAIQSFERDRILGAA